MSQKSHREQREKRWHGLAVSEGAALGRVLRFHASAPQHLSSLLETGGVGREVRRWRVAVRLARRQLLSIKPAPPGNPEPSSRISSTRIC
ncbi:MAG: hypothetical protein WKF30_06215 [Pyrinomonadaceae bacterium]